MDQYSSPYSAPRKTISKWWSIGFFIAAVIFFIIGGALIGSYLSAGYKTCTSALYYGDYTYDYSCFAGNIGQYNGGIAMLVLGGLSKFIGWVLLIVYCVQRRR